MEPKKQIKETGITVDPSMIHPLMNGLKTEIRKVITPQPPEGFNHCRITENGRIRFQDQFSASTFPVDGIVSRYGKPGDILWVQEGFHHGPQDGMAIYQADWKVGDAGITWHDPSLMPRYLSRIILKIISIYPEKLSSIQAVSAAMEMGENRNNCSHQTIEKFFRTWKKIHGDSWKADDPWVWAIGVKVIQVETLTMTRQTVNGPLSL